MSTVFGIGWWGLSSILMSFCNKAAVIHTMAPFALLTSQLLTATFVSVVSCDLKFGKGVGSFAYSVPILFVLMLASSMLALKYVTLGTFVAVRNVAPVVTLLIEAAVLGGVRVDLGSICALLGLSLGTAIYEYNNLHFSLFGTSLLLANMLFGTAERLCQRYFLTNERMETTPSTLTFINNSIGACAVGLYSFYTHANEFERLMAHCDWSVITSCIMGTSLSYSGFYLQTRVSATEFIVLGCITKLVVLALGIVYMADESGAVALCGLVLSLGSGAVYAIWQKRPKRNDVSEEKDLLQS